MQSVRKSVRRLVCAHLQALQFYFRTKTLSDLRQWNLRTAELQPRNARFFLGKNNVVFSYYSVFAISNSSRMTEFSNSKIILITNYYTHLAKKIHTVFNP
jgi:hypothetical protein